MEVKGYQQEPRGGTLGREADGPAMHRVPNRISAVVLVPVNSLGVSSWSGQPVASWSGWALCAMLGSAPWFPSLGSGKCSTLPSYLPWLLACLSCHLHIGPDNPLLSTHSHLPWLLLTTPADSQAAAVHAGLPPVLR